LAERGSIASFFASKTTRGRLSLSRSKKSIAPKNWFGGSCIDKNIEDIPFGKFEFIDFL
jgi:hypothetical protein